MAGCCIRTRMRSTKEFICALFLRLCDVGCLLTSYRGAVSTLKWDQQQMGRCEHGGFCCYFREMGHIRIDMWTSIAVSWVNGEMLVLADFWINGVHFYQAAGIFQRIWNNFSTWFSSSFTSKLFEVVKCLQSSRSRENKIHIRLFHVRKNSNKRKTRLVNTTSYVSNLISTAWSQLISSSWLISYRKLHSNDSLKGEMQRHYSG